jgi:hypothetical protein
VLLRTAVKVGSTTICLSTTADEAGPPSGNERQRVRAPVTLLPEPVVVVAVRISVKVATWFGSLLVSIAVEPLWSVPVCVYEPLTRGAGLMIRERLDNACQANP